MTERQRTGAVKDRPDRDKAMARGGEERRTESGWSAAELKESVRMQAQGVAEGGCVAEGEVFITGTVKSSLISVVLNVQGQTHYLVLPLTSSQQRGSPVWVIRILSQPTVCLSQLLYRKFGILTSSIPKSALSWLLQNHVWLRVDVVQKSDASQRVPLLCCSRSES